MLDRHVVAFPQHQHDEVLRIGQAEPVEQWLVDAVERVSGRIDREADWLSVTRGGRPPACYSTIGKPPRPIGDSEPIRGYCEAFGAGYSIADN